MDHDVQTRADGAARSDARPTPWLVAAGFVAVCLCAVTVAETRPAARGGEDGPIAPGHARKTSAASVGGRSAAPPAAALTSVSATSWLGQGVLVSWKTGFEVDNLGFHVYREQRGERVRVTTDLVAGSALFAGAGTKLVAGQSYAWWDEQGVGVSSAVYWLEEWELGGTRRWHGPVVVREAHAGDRPRGGADPLAGQV